MAKANSSLSLSGFEGALKRANISGEVDSMVNLTIFATTAAAISTANLNPPEAPAKRLADIFSYHIVSNGNALYSPDLMALANNTNLTTLEGKSLKIHFNGSSILVNNATIATANVLTKNGVIHIVNQLLNPENPKGFVGGFKPEPSGASIVSASTSLVAMALAIAAFVL